MAGSSHTPVQHRENTTTVTIGGERFRITASAGSDGELRDVLIQWSERGSAAAGLTEGYAAALSLGLRHRVPLASLLRQGLGLRFAPAGATDDPDVPRATSVADYVARRLAIDWLPYADRAGLGVCAPARARSGKRDWVLRFDHGASGGEGSW